jgi:hypothetical protein
LARHAHILRTMPTVWSLERLRGIVSARRGLVAGVAAIALLAACGGDPTLPGLDAAPDTRVPAAAPADAPAAGTDGAPAAAPAGAAGAPVGEGAGAPPQAAPLPVGDGPPDATRLEADWRAGLTAWYACLARPAACDASFTVPGSAWAEGFAAEVEQARIKVIADADGPAAHRVVLRRAATQADAATIVACAYDRRRFTLVGFGWEVRNWTTRLTWDLRWHAGAWRWNALEERITHLGEDGCADGA